MQLAGCHPERKYHAHGLCKPCYEKWLKATNPIYKQNQRKNNDGWAARNPDKIKQYAKARKERERNSPTHKLQRRNQFLKYKYGITVDDYDTLLVKQNNACALCYRKQGQFKLHVDHNHQTQKVRGLLCHQCNWYLGTIDADPTIIERIQRYRAEV